VRASSNRPETPIQEMMSENPLPRSASVAIILILFAAAFQPVTAQSSPTPVSTTAADHELAGYASWYAGKFQGRLTANGERFDTNKLTAAHKTLPFGTIVEVTHLGNGLTVQVRINDRGPFVEGRVIDLSRAAAEAISMTAEGIARVRLRVVSLPPAPTHRVQVASFSQASNARRTRDALRERGVPAAIEQAGGLHRVVVTGLEENEIAPLLERLASLGHRSVLVRQERP
jgi:rare lipoprotein A